MKSPGARYFGTSRSAFIPDTPEVTNQIYLKPLSSPPHHSLLLDVHAPLFFFSRRARTK
jgi:hypothetical protein